MSNSVDKAMHHKQTFHQEVYMVRMNISQYSIHVNSMEQSTCKCLVVTSLLLIFQAFELFRNSIGDLYTAPRLLEPVWLNMMTFSTHRVSLCQRFLKEFVFAIDRYENRK